MSKKDDLAQQRARERAIALADRVNYESSGDWMDDMWIDRFRERLAKRSLTERAVASEHNAARRRKMN